MVTQIFQIFYLIFMVICEIKWSYDFYFFEGHVWIIVVAFIFFLQNICFRSNMGFNGRKQILKFINDHILTKMTTLKKSKKIIWPLNLTNDHKNKKKKNLKICATIKSCKWPWKKVNDHFYAHMTGHIQIKVVALFAGYIIK